MPDSYEVDPFTIPYAGAGDAPSVQGASGYERVYGIDAPAAPRYGDWSSPIGPGASSSSSKASHALLLLGVAAIAFFFYSRR